MSVEDMEQIRVLVKHELKAAWDQMLEDRKISQQDAVIALMQFTLKQDPLLQSMLFAQVPEKHYGDLSRLVLKALAGDKSGGKDKGKV